jgi:hypothetical protein
MEWSNIVPLFKTFDELERDQLEIIEQFRTDWDAAWKTFEAARSAIETDKAALAKLGDEPPDRSLTLAPLTKAEPYASVYKTYNDLVSEFARVKAENRRLKARLNIELAKRQAVATLKMSREAAIRKRDERLWGHSTVAKRSARFANAQSRPYFGPAATVSALEVKKHD